MAKVRDSIIELAFHASREFIVSQSQTKDVIVRSTKREHHANRLSRLNKIQQLRSIIFLLSVISHLSIHCIQCV